MRVSINDLSALNNSMSPYPYSPDTTRALINSISQPQFQPYLDRADGDLELGLRHYVWNAALASSMHGPLHVLEITLRNAVHDRMKRHHGASWFDLPNMLKSSEKHMVDEVRLDLIKRNGVSTPDKIIAELSFRFWVGIFARKYDRLWWSTLHTIFSPQIQRNDLHEQLDRLRTLRNRIAHHEPILQRHLMADLADIKNIAGSISIVMLDWLNWHEQVTTRFGTVIGQIDLF